jgi:hypothetical protein
MTLVKGTRMVMISLSESERVRRVHWLTEAPFAPGAVNPFGRNHQSIRTGQSKNLRVNLVN